jgi:hypothetical protein
MKLTKLHLAIMSRDACSESDAIFLVEEMKDEVQDGRNPENVLEDEGFEPDYFFDLIDTL